MEVTNSNIPFERIKIEPQKDIESLRHRACDDYRYHFKIISDAELLQ